MLINRGDIYWVRLDFAQDPQSPIPHPYMIVQDDALNNGSQHIIGVRLTSNLRRISLPGNVLLQAGEANLPKPSVVEVSKLTLLDKDDFGEYIGTVSDYRIVQVLAGIRFVQTFFVR